MKGPKVLDRADWIVFSAFLSSATLISIRVICDAHAGLVVPGDAPRIFLNVSISTTWASVHNMNEFWLQYR